MNLIDRAVEQLDFAPRRRFLWIPADCRQDLIVPVVGKRWKPSTWTSSHDFRHPWDEVQPDIQLLASRATALNDGIEPPGAQYKVGHTYSSVPPGLHGVGPALLMERGAAAGSLAGLPTVSPATNSSVPRAQFTGHSGEQSDHATAACARARRCSRASVGVR